MHVKAYTIIWSDLGNPVLPSAWHATTPPGIIHTMPVSRFTPRTMTAALLPLTFLWLCMACALICAQETAGAADHSLARRSAGLIEMQGGSGCEGCPFVSLPKVTASDSRSAFDAGSQTAGSNVPPSPSSYFTAVAGLVRPRAQAPPTAPPFQLPPTLRI